MSDSEDAPADSQLLATGDDTDGDDSYHPPDHTETSEGDEDEEDDEDDESNGEPGSEDDEPEIDMIARFSDKLTEMQKLSQSPELSQNEEKQRQYLTKYRHYLKPQTEAVKKTVRIEIRNLLFRMAYDVKPVPWLVRHLVEKFPELLHELEEANRGALLVAVSKSDVVFVKTVLDSKVEDAHLKKALHSIGPEDENCIHWAVKNGFDPDTTIRLVERASPFTLAAVNKRGLTPLHYAVEYQRCTTSGLRVVRALIEYGDIAFDKRTGKPEYFSPYRYHLDTKRRYIKQEAAPKVDKPKKKKIVKSSTSKDVPDLLPKEPPAQAKAAPGKESKSWHDIPVAPTPTTTKRRDDDLDDWERIKQNGDSANKTSKSRTEATKTAGIMVAEMRPPPFPKPLRRATTVEFGKETTIPTLVTKDNAHQPHQPHDGAAQDSKPSTPKLKRPKLTTSESRHSKSSRSKVIAEAPSPEIANTVAKELKLHYLRTTFWQRPEFSSGSRSADAQGPADEAAVVRTHNSAIEFLFGENKEDKHICFDFPPNVVKDEIMTINFADFETSYKGLSFDEVLRYVDFGPVALAAPLDPPRMRKSDSDKVGAGRKDMVALFSWLSKKGVTNIIKVIVADNKEPPHSDQAIEDALKPFDVEILDWRKLDLDPRAIKDACQNSKLRELHLRWSGNNAILRAWSEPDGLAMLKDLVQIRLHQTTKGLEPPVRTRKDVQEFRDRLKAVRNPKWPPIKVEYDKPSDQTSSRPKRGIKNADTDRRSLIDTHRWLGIMDKFTEGISKLPTNLPPDFPSNPLTIDELPLELRKDVKVALIDDGADFMHKAIANQIENGRSFDSNYEDPDLSGAPGPFHGSTTGHGTTMAYMIGRVCPSVKIFVCKLNVTRREGGEKASFTAKSAADAVEFAVNRGFDIISMSWTVQRVEDEQNNNAADIARLQAALERAVKNKILVFCSAPDVGITSAQVLSSYYPFGCPTTSESIFKVGAANADGSVYNWAGSQRTLDFILPGHNVEMGEADKIHEEDDIPKTGSSVATALAAGLAALIIHVVRLGAIYNFHRRKSNDPNAVSEESLRTIKRFSAMKDAFVRVSDGGYSEKDRRVEVESFFQDPGKKLEMDGYTNEQKWEVVTKLARDLVSWTTQGRVGQTPRLGTLSTL
ncbi:hypothetical protein B0T24DRAFT_554041 [Lasiosphaeria ovina]|uniref:Peptidase S8/S53 domain-containing protein n=1 Tax=Lasiosphaeria ovina TaxID=92902 RepID=A0AAE0KDX4_9PEZI|nr:hypothetical protein B0T24DRAFT_554041 [Lasiosphaeria ovina]